MSNGVLVIEDEPTLAKNIKRYLERGDYEVRIAGSGEAGLEAYEAFQPDVVLLDYQLPGINGLDVLSRVRAIDTRAKIILVTAHGSTQIAVDAMKAGAYDYLNKPVVLSELKLLIDKAVGQERLEGTLAYYHDRLADSAGLSALIGSSPSMVELKERIAQLLRTESSLTDDDLPAVLVTGETGTGKELIARALHFDSTRGEFPFVEINCATLPGDLVEAELFGYERGAFTDARSRKLGLVEAAHGGTLFLDEVGELDQKVQVKLLKLLEDKTVRRLGSVRDHKVNVRIVAATNRELQDLVRARQFRSDLYFRLRIVTLTAPPLRNRGEDVLTLAEHFLRLHATRYGKGNMRLGKGTKSALLTHPWSGNVRELRNAIEQAVLLSTVPVITLEQLALSPVFWTNDAKSWSAELPPEGIKLEEVEKDLVLQALEREDWNVTRAARLLGLSRDTLRYRMEKFGLKRSL